MKRALLVTLLLVGCAEDNPTRHLPDAPAADAEADVELTIAKAGNGKGTVTSSPDGVTCGDNCTATFAAHATVVLTAQPDSGSTFTGWSGACTGDSPTCEVSLDGTTTVTATFALAKHTVTITKSGPGGGTIHGEGVDCANNCTLEVDHGTALSLTAAPGALAVFGGWGGACTGMGACNVTVTDDITINGNFALDNFTLFAVTNGTGAGSVVSTPAGINCGTDCNQVYTANQTVTLTAVPATGSSFGGWTGGGCTGTAPCVVTVTGPRTVTGTFTLNQYALTVTKTGQGTVTGTGIACGTDCSESYNYNTSVSLTVTPATGYSFTGWSGACSGTGACVVTMSTAKQVTANFAINTYALTVTKTGQGTVTGTGIACGTDCSETYNYNTSVTLSAAAATGYTFAGWSGACTGAGPCVVTMTAAKQVTATFTLNTFALTVTKTGSGTVTGAGIACGTDCSETVGYGSTVTLSAAPATGYAFAGWGGACTGTGPCTVTITGTTNVTATFTINTYALTVTKTGQGTVTGTGIACGTDCSETYNYNTSVALTAAAATGYTFAGWAGACTGTGACTVTMTAAKQVTATFTINRYTLSVATVGGGTVTGTGISCGNDCSETYDYNTLVALTAVPAQGYAFTGWSGACSGSGSCTVTMNAAKSVTATFAQTFTLQVKTDGFGVIVGNGLSCAANQTCNLTLTTGTLVTLSATAYDEHHFTGWSGPCTGLNSICSFTISMATSTNGITAVMGSFRSNIQ